MSSTTDVLFAPLPQASVYRLRLRAITTFIRRKPLGAACLAIIAFYWIMALLAPVVSHTGYNDPLYGPAFHGPSTEFWFGTDQTGRDVYSRVVWAARTDLLVSLLTAVSGIFFATAIGLVSGYFGGIIDMLFQRVVDTIQALPGLVLLLVVVAIFGKAIIVAMTTIMILGIPVGARVIRAEVMQLRAMQYVEAARCTGCSEFRIMTRHVLRGVVPTAIVLMTIALGVNLLIEAALAFLGLVSSTYPDWGTMLNAGALAYMEQAPWLAVAPGLAITVIAFAYSMFGDALRDVLDPRLRGA